MSVTYSALLNRKPPYACPTLSLSSRFGNNPPHSLVLLCPHGRPLSDSQTKQQLESLFPHLLLLFICYLLAPFLLGCFQLPWLPACSWKWRHKSAMDSLLLYVRWTRMFSHKCPLPRPFFSLECPILTSAVPSALVISCENTAHTQLSASPQIECASPLLESRLHKWGVSLCSLINPKGLEPCLTHSGPQLLNKPLNVVE